jgi:hypothetical protein
MQLSLLPVIIILVMELLAQLHRPSSTHYPIIKAALIPIIQAPNTSQMTKFQLKSMMYSRSFGNAHPVSIYLGSATDSNPGMSQTLDGLQLVIGERNHRCITIHSSMHIHLLYFLVQF